MKKITGFAVGMTLLAGIPLGVGSAEALGLRAKLERTQSIRYDDSRWKGVIERITRTRLGDKDRMPSGPAWTPPKKHGPVWGWKVWGSKKRDGGKLRQIVRRKGDIKPRPKNGPAVPEPGAALVFGAGLAAVALRTRRR